VTSGTSCTADGQFCSPDNMNCDAGILNDTGFVYEFTFTQPGMYHYFCAIHCFAGMTGVVSVRLRPTPRPRPTPWPRPEQAGVCRSRASRDHRSRLQRLGLLGKLCPPGELVPRMLVFVRHCTTSIELVCFLQMFFSQLKHAEILEPPSKDPMVKRIVGSEQVGLFFIEIGFVKLA